MVSERFETPSFVIWRVEITTGGDPDPRMYRSAATTARTARMPSTHHRFVPALVCGAMAVAEVAKKERIRSFESGVNGEADPVANAWPRLLPVVIARGLP